MARIIPAKPRGKPDQAFLAFYRVLKTLPDDFTAWLSLEGRTGVRPHVFLVWRERHAFLIQVAETSQQLAESAIQADLPKNLSCITFFQWAAKCLGGWNERMWSPRDQERVLSRLKEGFPALEKLSTTFLADEVGWMKDHRLLNKDDE